MTTPIVAPFGAWKSPISADLIVGGTTGLGQIMCDGADLYWSESRPAEEGRNAIVRLDATGRAWDAIPRTFNARTRVHEYGGAAFLAYEGTLYFANYADQRIYRTGLGTGPVAVTPPAPMRYADFVMDRRRQRLICVREDHSPDHQVINALVAVDLNGENAGRILVQGNDFYATPRLSPDGTRLAWLTWNHPNMPWDGNELWLAKVETDGTLHDIRMIAGGAEESIFQPQWSPDGTLYFVSDRTGWWNLYRWEGGQTQPLHEMEAEFGVPQWEFGQSTYAFVGEDQIICAYTQMATWRLATLDVHSQQFTSLDLPYTVFEDLIAVPGHVYCLAGSPTEPASLIHLDPATRQVKVVHRSTRLQIDPAYVSVPQAIEFPTEGGRSAHGLFYAPANRDYTAPAGERPPLVVMSHGGPTSAATSRLNLKIQFFASRGFAVLDVNYGGSTGYGRAYRGRLNDAWGIVDVDDCANGARYLAAQGMVDGQRMAITGGSAGGYTTLAALTFRDVFQAGASRYGVGDLEALATDTHKFESRYLDRLVGPYPERRDLYLERSPIHFTARLTVPLILFQGLEDPIVPPQQAETMFAAVRAKGLPVAYLPFAGEQHGFRRAENIKRALEGELYFYSRVFGFELADPVEPVPIENMS